jgi:hypothetical protein
MARCWGLLQLREEVPPSDELLLVCMEGEGEQGQPVLLLLAGATVRLWREGSRRCLGYRIVRL